jgi:hypothetical protein
VPVWRTLNNQIGRDCVGGRGASGRTLRRFEAARNWDQIVVEYVAGSDCDGIAGSTVLPLGAFLPSET